MEPGRGGREDRYRLAIEYGVDRPQWSPAVVAGKTRGAGDGAFFDWLRPQWSPAVVAGKTGDDPTNIANENLPQWSPAVVAGKTHATARRTNREAAAAMEPGRGGREDLAGALMRGSQHYGGPQWSPAVVAGKTADEVRRLRLDDDAAMEPGRGGREDVWLGPAPEMRVVGPQWSPAVVAGKTARLGWWR